MAALKDCNAQLFSALAFANIQNLVLHTDGIASSILAAPTIFSDS
tara:strand:- start:365 stop:499 length:135 start_codon:yes stop_codon:yes gene_type:complete